MKTETKEGLLELSRVVSPFVICLILFYVWNWIAPADPHDAWWKLAGKVAAVEVLAAALALAINPSDDALCAMASLTALMIVSCLNAFVFGFVTLGFVPALLLAIAGCAALVICVALAALFGRIS